MKSREKERNETDGEAEGAKTGTSLKSREKERDKVAKESKRAEICTYGFGEQGRLEKHRQIDTVA